MSEFKGTKGKIKVIEISGGLAKGIYLSGENQTFFLAEIISIGRTHEENLSNAILFSKSHEMLEMLVRIMKTYDKGTQTYLDCQQLIKEVTTL